MILMQTTLTIHQVQDSVTISDSIATFQLKCSADDIL